MSLPLSAAQPLGVKRVRIVLLVAHAASCPLVPDSICKALKFGTWWLLRSTFCAIIAQLTEETQPLFETTLKSYAVSEDADAKFTCIVTGYPVPEVTWYKDDEEMDRYCGLPKYEIFRHGNRHTLQLYKCKEEDAAIYQASARNNKGIVSCSGVLEVGTMSEYKIHQRWFAKLKRNAEAKLREIEQSRKRGKENVEVDQLRRVSPDRFQRKRRLTGEVGMRSGTSLWDKEETVKVRIPDGKPRFSEADKAKGKETLVNTPNLFSNNFITGRLEAEVTTNGDSSLESGEENSEGRTNGFLNYIYETVENIKNKPAAKEVSAKKKKKEEKNIVNAKQSVSRQEDEIQPSRKISAQKVPATSILPDGPSSRAANGELRKPEPRERPDQVVGKPSSRPRAAPSDANVYFSLKDMYFDLSGKAKNELLASEAKDRGIAVPCPDVEEPVPAPGTALQRARPEEGQLEVFKAQEAARSETQEGKSTETLAAETDGDFSTTLQHPSWSSEPVIDAEGSLPPGEVSEISDESTLETDVQDPVGALETEVEAWPSSEENARQNILETDLVESPAPEVELPQFPQCEEETDSSLRIQEHPGDFQSASLEEQLHAHGPCEVSENIDPGLSTASHLQVLDSSLREEGEEEASQERMKGDLSETEVKPSEKHHAPCLDTQEPSMMVLSQEDSQHTSVTSPNPPVSIGVPQPTGTEHLVQKDLTPVRSESKVGQPIPAPRRRHKELVSSKRLLQEAELDAGPADRSHRGGPEVEATSRENQEETTEFLKDRSPGVKMDVDVESEGSPGIVPEVTVESAVPCQRILEKPPPVLPAVVPPALPASQEGLAGKDQSVAQLMKDVKREMEARQPARQAAREPEAQVGGNAVDEAYTEERPPSPLKGDENEQEVQASENGTITPKAPSIQDSAQPETVMDENEEKEQQKKLVSSLKNYLLLLLKITESDKKKNGKKQEAKEEKGPPSAIPKHMSDVGIAGLTPRTSRKIFERVETNQLFQSAEQLQLTPRTSRKLTGMINQELLACKEGLGLEPESPPLPSVPSIVVGDVPDEQTRPPELSPVTSNEVPSALPSATPQELASGARRKIYLPKAKPPDEMESVAPESQGRSKRDSPTVSPQQGRRNATLLPSPAPASPPLEKRSPTLARKMATLEVPKIYEEPDEESTNVADSTLGPLENLEETTSEAQPVEPRKANDPFKAPQVIRKIRPEQFSDASGNLKLWCQFFNILSDSKLTWYKDEVPVADAKRSSGDEGQAALAIVQVSLKDCGVYQCTIQNEYGTDSTDLLLSAEVLSGFISKEEIEAGEEIEMTPMVFAKGLADSGFWGDKLFGRIMVEDLEVGQGFLWKACRARAIYGLEPVFESGHTGIIKVHNFIPFGGRSESTLVERNYDITIQECKIQNSSREYCKIFAAEARAVAGFGPVPEIIPLYLIYRPANNIPYATMEEDLPGQFESYCGRNGESSLAPGDTSEVGQKCCTFQHWLYQWTNGNFLVTDLEGVGWKVTNVRIATKTKGYQGLKESCSPGLLDHFAASHQCNYYCELLALKRLEVPQPPPKGKGSRSPVTGRKVSSANSSPQLQKKGLSSPQTSRKGSVSPKSTRKCPESGVAELVARPKAGDNGKGSRRH
uniref:non-specific serine/threonine protein kinase n=1 Tax=Salvator merianae TaxID=96440 RepID=A0A8D0BTQ4_SALMN